jgi:hypothetical protein
VKGVRTPVEKKKLRAVVLLKGQKGFTHSKLIVGIISRFKKRRVFTSMEFGVLVSIIEAFFCGIFSTSTFSFASSSYNSWALYLGCSREG